MTIVAEPASFATPASATVLNRVAAALTDNGFTTQVLEDVSQARKLISELIPAHASVFTGASETLRLSGIEADINTSDRYDAIKPKLLTMGRGGQSDEIRRLMATPDYIVASVHAVTQSGSLVIASGTGSQLPGFAGGAAHAIWIVGAQKIVPDLATGLRRVEEHCLPLENERAMRVYGSPSAVSRLLILNREPYPGRNTVLLLAEAIGF